MTNAQDDQPRACSDSDSRRLWRQFALGNEGQAACGRNGTGSGQREFVPGRASCTESLAAGSHGPALQAGGRAVRGNVEMREAPE